jgi:hypothetical protein
LGKHAGYKRGGLRLRGMGSRVCWRPPWYRRGMHVQGGWAGGDACVGCLNQRPLQAVIGSGSMTAGAAMALLDELGRWAADV